MLLPMDCWVSMIRHIAWSVCVCACVCVCVCVCVRACVRACVHVHVYTDMHVCHAMSTIHIPCTQTYTTSYNIFIKITGQFWDVPISINSSTEDGVFVDINDSDAPNHRHIPARKYSLTWDHFHQTCYYVGNSQGGPEKSRDQNESVIEGSYKDYETSGLFDTDFLYERFEDGICKA